MKMIEGGKLYRGKLYRGKERGGEGKRGKEELNIYGLPHSMIYNVDCIQFCVYKNTKPKHASGMFKLDFLGKMLYEANIS